MTPALHPKILAASAAVAHSRQPGADVQVVEQVVGEPRGLAHELLTPRPVDRPRLGLRCARLHVHGALQGEFTGFRPPWRVRWASRHALSGTADCRAAVREYGT